MKAIFKYQLDLEAPSAVMPVGSQILAVREQGDHVCLWALVDPTQTAIETRVFRIFGTGHGVDESQELEYLGTVMVYAGRLVFHVFEVKKYLTN